MTSFRSGIYSWPLLATFLAIVGLPGNAVADAVSFDRAARVASAWLLQQTGAVHRPVGVVDAQGAQLSRQQPLYYMLNMEPEGWVIVAGDDVAYPIVGYSSDGSIPQSNRPPAFEAWMSAVRDTIAAAAVRGSTQRPGAGVDSDAAAQIQSAWEFLDGLDTGAGARGGVSSGTVGPLLRTTWSQGKYYNALCPVEFNGPDDRALVGCVATAMGQIMRYHAYPSSGTGSHSYVHPRYGTLSASFGAANYDWSSMPGSGSLAAHNSAAAMLLHHAGVSVEMDYGPSSSGAYPSDMAPALRDFFRYEADDIVSRSSYTAAEWMGKLRADLDASRPVLYGGYGTGGHAFVCDGYTDNDYFHFNWGWDGYADGYFYLDDLTPGSGDFNSGQMAVFGIEPAEGERGGAFVQVLTQAYYAGVYDSYASYYSGLTLAAGGDETYRYYAYLYAYYAYQAAYQCYMLAPYGSETEMSAYYLFLHAYYRYMYATYDYLYGGYGYYVLLYDLYGDLYRASVSLLGAEGR